MMKKTLMKTLLFALILAVGMLADFCQQTATAVEFPSTLRIESPEYPHFGYFLFQVIGGQVDPWYKIYTEGG